MLRGDHRSLTCGEVVGTENLEWITLVGVQGQHGLTRLFQPAFLIWKLKGNLIRTAGTSAEPKN